MVQQYQRVASEAVDWKSIDDSKRYEYYVNGESGDRVACGTSTGCQYLSDAIKSAISHPGLITIINTKSAPVENQVVFGITASCSITGASRSGSTITVDSTSGKDGSVFELTPSATSPITLTLSTLTITLDTSSSSISQTLIRIADSTECKPVTVSLMNLDIAQSGTNGISTFLIDTQHGCLSLNDVEFKTIKVTSDSLLFVDLTSSDLTESIPAGLSITSPVTFTSITGAANTSAVMTVILSDGMTLDMSGMSFTNCGTYSTATDDIGCAVKVTLGDDEGSFTPGASFEVDGDTFDKKHYGLWIVVQDADNYGYLTSITSLMTGELTTATAWTNNEYKHYLTLGTWEGPLTHYQNAPSLTVAQQGQYYMH